jgi:hypothetical protein
MRVATAAFSAIVCVTVAGGAIGADDVEAQIRSCRALPIILARVACYDRIPVGIPNVEASVDAAPRDGTGSGIRWTIQKELDALTDKPRVQATVLGASRPAGAMTPASLSLRCYSQTMEVIVEMGVFLNSSHAVPVKYRFDNGQVVAQDWLPSTAGTAIFAHDALEFLESAERAGKVVIEAAGYQGTSYRASFDLTGIDKVLPEISGCRIRSDSPERGRDRPK